MKCVICKAKYEGYGNNAMPIIEGRCCNDCDGRLVVPLRIKLHHTIESVKLENKR